MGSFEGQDLEGDTLQGSGTATVGGSLFPASPGNIISEIALVNCNRGTLEISFDGGVTKFPVSKHLIWKVKGDKRQIHISGNADWTLLYNVENW